MIFEVVAERPNGQRDRFDLEAACLNDLTYFLNPLLRIISIQPKTVMKYVRKDPLPVDAVQFTGTDVFVRLNRLPGVICDVLSMTAKFRQDGIWWTAQIGDWIVLEEGKLVLYHNEEFHATYEEVEC